MGFDGVESEENDAEEVEEEGDDDDVGQHIIGCDGTTKSVSLFGLVQSV